MLYVNANAELARPLPTLQLTSDVCRLFGRVGEDRNFLHTFFQGVVRTAFIALAFKDFNKGRE